MKRLFGLVAAVILLDTMFYAAIVPLLPEYRDELGLSKGAAGVLSASYAAGTLTAAIPAGFFAARVGVRSATLAGLGLLAASSFAFAAADDIVVLDLARFAQGVGGALSWTGGLTWIISAAPAERRGEMIGSVLAVAIAGIMLGPVLGGIASAVGPEPVFGLVGVAALALGAITLSVPGAEPVASPSPRVVAASMLSRQLLFPFWLVALPSIFAGLFDVLIPLRLDELGATGIAVGAVFVVAALVEAVLSRSIGRFSDRRGRWLPIRLGLLAGAGAALLLPLPSTVLLVGLATVGAVLALALVWSPAMALLSDVAEERGLDLAFASALVNLAWAGGQVVGGSAGASFAEVTSDAVAYAAVAALLALSALAVRARGRRPERLDAAGAG